MGIFLTALLTSIVFPGCNPKSTVEKPNKSYEVENEHAGHAHFPAEDGEAGVALLDSNAWKQDLDKPDAVDRMIAYANTLRTRRPQVSPAQQMADRISMVEIGDELQKREMTELQQIAAFQIKSQTLMEFVAEGDLDYRAPLVKLIDEYRKHPNLEVARSAEFLELSLVIQDYFKDENKDFSKAEETIVNMAKAHPNDPEVVNTISGTVANLLTLGQRDQSLSAMRKLAEVYASSEDESAQRIADIYEDRVFMVDSNFDKVATDTRKGVDGALEKYQELIRVLARRRGRNEFYAETVLGVRFLEQLGLLDDARELYEILAKTYDASAEPVVVEQSKRDIERGNRRLDLVGKPLQIVGNLPDGTAFDPGVLKDKD